MLICFYCKCACSHLGSMSLTPEHLDLTDLDYQYCVCVCVRVCVCAHAHVCSCVHTLSCFSHDQLFAPLWTIALQSPLSIGLSRQEYWSGLPCPLLGIFLTQGWNPCVLCLLNWQVGSLPLAPPGKPISNVDISMWISRLGYLLTSSSGYSNTSLLVQVL